MAVQSEHARREISTERVDDEPSRRSADADARTQAVVEAFQLWIVAGRPDEEGLFWRFFVSLNQRAEERMCADLPKAGPSSIEREVDRLFQGEIEWGPFCPPCRRVKAVGRKTDPGVFSGNVRIARARHADRTPHVG